MKASLNLNGIEIGEYAAQSGFKVSEVSRRKRSVVTLDGTDFVSEIIKHKIEVTLLDMSDYQLKTVLQAIKSRPVSGTYSDFDTGTTFTGYFNISNVSYSARKAIGTGVTAMTYMTGISFTAEER